jgi:hypothetical protein
MHKFLVAFAVVAAILVSAFALSAPQTQQRPPAEPLPELKDSPAARFVGTWKGTATHSMPGQAEPSEVEMVETVQWKMGESALLIEGRGVMKDDATGEETVVHDAMAVIRFDPRTRKLMFHAFKVGEPANVAELEMLGNGDMRWSLQPAPQIMIRFTISITDDTWTEIGEMSRDGGVTYHPFLQMNLERVK